MKNKIGWCTMTFNPCWGCLNHCEYCYARTFAKRFGREMAENECHYCWKNNIGTSPYTKRAFIKCTEKIRNFIPTFLNAQFDKKFPQKAQKIFVGSMSEIVYWDKVWIQKVIDKTKEYPQHIFQFLTKDPRVYEDWVFPENCWLGVTITRNPKDGERSRWDYYQFKQDNPNNLKFYCFEPLLVDMQLQYYLNLEDISWVIIGAETGTRKGKIIPSREWIENIIYYCRINKIPVYLKDSLKNIYPVEIKEFPIRS